MCGTHTTVNDMRPSAKWMAARQLSQCGILKLATTSPGSKGGSDAVENLYPICGVCNKSMGNRHTIKEFGKIMKGEDSGCCVIA